MFRYAQGFCLFSINCDLLHRFHLKSVRELKEAQNLLPVFGVVTWNVSLWLNDGSCQEKKSIDGNLISDKVWNELEVEMEDFSNRATLQ